MGAAGPQVVLFGHGGIGARHLHGRDQPGRRSARPREHDCRSHVDPRGSSSSRTSPVMGRSWEVTGRATPRSATTGLAFLWPTSSEVRARASRSRSSVSAPAIFTTACGGSACASARSTSSAVTRPRGTSRRASRSAPSRSCSNGSRRAARRSTPPASSSSTPPGRSRRRAPPPPARRSPSSSSPWLAPVQRVLDRAIQGLGGLGMTDATPLAFWYAHERAARIYDGADEVHIENVAKRILRGYGIKTP